MKRASFRGSLYYRNAFRYLRCLKAEVMNIMAEIIISPLIRYVS